MVEQNKCLIDVVKELEIETSNRLSLLENKLHKDETFLNEASNIVNGNKNSQTEEFESDLKNLLEVIRRAREDKLWSVDGLEFKTILFEDIFGKVP